MDHSCLDDGIFFVTNITESLEISEFSSDMQ